MRGCDKEKQTNYKGAHFYVSNSNSLSVSPSVKISSIPGSALKVVIGYGILFSQVTE